MIILTTLQTPKMAAVLENIEFFDFLRQVNFIWTNCILFIYNH